jgi:hypothetical protein
MGLTDILTQKIQKQKWNYHRTLDAAYAGLATGAILTGLFNGVNRIHVADKIFTKQIHPVLE